MLGSLEVSTVLMPGTLVAMATCAFIVFLLYRRITVIARLAELLWVGVAIAIAWIIFAGLTHFSAARAFDFPRGAFTLSPEFFTGMGAAMLIATYDYWGYYNVCFLGGEVKDPGRTIPRALILSIVRGRRDLHRDEHQCAGRGSLARDDWDIPASRTTTSSPSSWSASTATGRAGPSLL